MAAGLDAFLGESLLQGLRDGAGLDAFQGESLPQGLRDGRRTRRIPRRVSAPGFV